MLNVALLQMIACQTQKENLEKGLTWCRRAKAMGADIALFPEMWNCGYTVTNNPAKNAVNAVAADGAFAAAFRDLAKELNMAIAITILEHYDPLPRNTMILFDRRGDEVLRYAKVHTCDFDVERNLTPGDDFYVAELDTAEGPVQIGAMICYDREFPESARILMLEGAELILVPNACPMEINRLTQLRARAFENMLGIATANYAFGHPDCNGHSSAFDGIAYDDSHSDSRDTLIVEAGEAEGIYLAPFDLAAIRRNRKVEIHGNCFRRPALYQKLIETSVRPPFIREGRRTEKD